MICLGIESTAHTFGIGIVELKNDQARILANQRDMFHTDEGGIIPALASQHHVDVCDKILDSALKEAKISMKEVDLISFSQGPGFGHTLRIGAIAARTLALANDIPIVGVNHCIAHLEIGEMLFKGCKDPILLYVSGANTQVISFEEGKYRILGETLDNGVGNFLDAFARELDLGFPGGPKIMELAKKGKNFIELPYVVKGMDISVGGLLTNAKQKLAKGFDKADLAYSIQETVFSMLIEVAERALAHCDKSNLLLGGGVACNLRLQEMAHKMCKDRGAKCFVPPNQVLVDNGAMIAWLGIKTFLGKGKKGDDISETTIRPYERTDDVIISWKP